MVEGHTVSLASTPPGLASPQPEQPQPLTPGAFLRDIAVSDRDIRRPVQR